jgi:hypothetical protein
MFQHILRETLWCLDYFLRSSESGRLAFLFIALRFIAGSLPSSAKRATFSRSGSRKRQWDCFSGSTRSVIDGPFTPVTEQIVGYWIWEVKSVNEAVEWLKRCPNPMLVDSEIEIRNSKLRILPESAAAQAATTQALRFARRKHGFDCSQLTRARGISTGHLALAGKATCWSRNREDIRSPSVITWSTGKAHKIVRIDFFAQRRQPLKKERNLRLAIVDNRSQLTQRNATTCARRHERHV